MFCNNFDLARVTALAGEFAALNGIICRRDNRIVQLPCTLIPSPFPRTFWEYGLAIQPDFNILYHKVSLDHEFLERILLPVLGQDEYISHLWSIYSDIRKCQKSQQWFLGLNRSDYMVSMDPALDDATIEGLNQRLGFSLSLLASDDQDSSGDSRRSWTGLNLLQVEFNLMASSFAGLVQRLTQQHRVTLALCGGTKQDINKIPDSPVADNFASAILQARQYYLQSTADLKRDALKDRPVSILMVVSEDETNIFDQRMIEQSLVCSEPSVRVLHFSFKALVHPTKRMHLDSNQILYVDDEEIAVVYYRFGYTPAHFPDQESWSVKACLERSMAIKCPCVQYMLANTKLVQAALAKRDNLSRFISPSNPSFEKLYSTFAAQYTLHPDMGISTVCEYEKAIQEALAFPHRFVLKPQREGGGNNIFDEELVEKLQSIIGTEESRSFVLMERLNPYIFKNYVIRPLDNNEASSPEWADLVSEFGVYGAFLGRGDEVALNSTSGHILRSKGSTINEGGIQAGFGCLDTPFLV